MYKYLSLVLGALLVVFGGYYLYKDHAHKAEVTALSNALAKSEGMLKETQSAYSVKAQELKDLKNSNKELQDKIDRRDEEIAALGEAVLTWKNKYLKIKDVKQTPVDSGGEVVVEIPADCRECLSNIRLRVDFDDTSLGYLRVYGHTLTSPAEAEVALEWTRGLKMNFTLTKTKENKYRLYLDTNNSDLVPATMDLKVDPSVFERDWYEKIGVGGNIALGDGLLTTLSVNYEFFRQWSLGASYSAVMADKMRSYYGANFVWFPFRR